MSKHTSMVFTPYIIRLDELSSFLSLCCWLCILCVIVFIWIFAKETFSFWIFLFELMIFLQSEMPTLPPFKTTNIGPFFKILFSIIPTFRDFLQILQFEWIAPLSALKYGLPWWLSDQESSCQCRRRGFDSWVGRWPGRGNGNPLECSCLGNLITGDPGGLQSMGSQRVGHNLANEQQQLQQSNSTYFLDLALVSCWIWVQRNSEEECIPFSVSVYREFVSIKR